MDVIARGLVLLTIKFQGEIIRGRKDPGNRGKMEVRREIEAIEFGSLECKYREERVGGLSGTT